MRWVCTERGKLVQESEFVIRLNGERADRARCVTVIFLKFVHRIKKLSAGSDGKKRRRGGLGGEAQRIQLACGGIELVGVDSFAAVVGVGADIQQIFLRWWLGVGVTAVKTRAIKKKMARPALEQRYVCVMIIIRIFSRTKCSYYPRL